MYSTRFALVVLTPLAFVACGTPEGLDQTYEDEEVQSVASPLTVTTGTGFAWPLNRAESGDGNFAACGRAYYTDIRHNGTDLAAPVGTPAYAVAAGTVRAISGPKATSGWGDGNYAVMIEHTSSKGKFLAVYGHIRSLTVASGSRVDLGQALGNVGPYAGGNHLHFGVLPGTTVPPSGWGRVSDPSCKNPLALNGFVSPIGYITTNSPR